MGRYSIILLMVVTILALAPIQVYSQDNSISGATAADETSIYGEVQSVTLSSGSITVQYYDYAADEEKLVEITTGTETKIENVSSLADVKAGDWVDVTYIAKDAGKMAKSVFVEKDEDIPASTYGPEMDEE